jgi:hypothetical protein
MTPVLILTQFMILGVVSLGYGVLFGALSALLFKNCSFLRVNAVV